MTVENISRSSQKNVVDLAGVEPATFWSHASNWATEAGFENIKFSSYTIVTT